MEAIAHATHADDAARHEGPLTLGPTPRWSQRAWVNLRLTVEAARRRSATSASAASQLVLDDVPALFAKARDVVHQGVQHLGRVLVPGRHLADDPQLMASPVGLRDVAGELLVRQVGVVIERSGGFDSLQSDSWHGFSAHVSEFRLAVRRLCDNQE